MRKIFLILFVFVSYVSYGQKFTFKRAFTQMSGFQPTFIKIQGELLVSDTSVVITQNGTKSEMVVTKTSLPSNDWKQYKVKLNEDSEMRLTLGPNPNPTKNEDYLLIIETKDKFTNKLSSFTYYLTSIK
jgi:hypothetical protein